MLALRVAVGAALLAFALLVAALVALRVRVGAGRALARRRTIGFLHPYCNDGGGGERVLWVAVRDLLARGVLDPAGWRIVVYTGDAVSDDEIRRHSLARFGVEVPPAVEFVRLSLRGAIDPKRYPVATLIGQALGSVVLAAEAICRAPPDVLVDTTGLGFCYPLLRAAGVARVAAYVHYPIVSSDMLRAVGSRRAAHNNAGAIARSSLGTALKLAYYRCLAALYGLAGRCALVVMANGSWTAAHLTELWRGKPALVFPPCDTAALRALPLTGPTGGRRPHVLSLAQFRPEKDHALQLRAFAILLAQHDASPPPRPARPKLLVAGAVRHAADQTLLDGLKAQAAALGLSDDDVSFLPNLPLAEVRGLLGSASVGLHTMWNEHFGIGVVEMMAAGLAVVAHASGGPAMDIIGPKGDAGLLAATDTEYADAMGQLLLARGAEPRRAAMGAAARSSVEARFSEAAFSEAFCAQLAAALP